MQDLRRGTRDVPEPTAPHSDLGVDPVTELWSSAASAPRPDFTAGLSAQHLRPTTTLGELSRAPILPAHEF